MNKVIINGNLTKKIELRYTTSNKAIGIFSLASRRAFKNVNGEYESDFINCVIYGNQAEILSKYTDKGSKIMIEGRIQTGSYTNKEGATVYTTNVVVDRFEFLGSNQKFEEKKEENKTDKYNNAFEEFGEQISIEDNFLD
jgi:single-strand DNA-binding protein